MFDVRFNFPSVEEGAGLPVADTGSEMDFKMADSLVDTTSYKRLLN